MVSDLIILCGLQFMGRVFYFSSSLRPWFGLLGLEVDVNIKFELTESEDDKARGCPFCGCESLDGYTDGTGYWIQCRDCQASGPYAPSRVAIIFGWNRRT